MYMERYRLTTCKFSASSLPQKLEMLPKILFLRDRIRTGGGGVPQVGENEKNMR